jgi:hypothetical protein
MSKIEVKPEKNQIRYQSRPLNETGSQSYQTLISLLFRFSLVSLIV